VASCRLCQIDPFAYLRDVIERVSTHPAKQIAALTPWGWKESSQDPIIDTDPSRPAEAPSQRLRPRSRR
jgi:hypothetical protein